MIILLAILTLALIVPSLAQAAYLEPTASPPERLPNGSTKVIYYFRGDANEKAVDIPYISGPRTTDQEIRNWVDDRLTELEQAEGVAKLQSLQNGAKVTRLPRVPAAQRASDTWWKKINSYNRVCTHGFGASVLGGCTALKSDIEATYQAGFLDAQ